MRKTPVYTLAAFLLVLLLRSTWAVELDCKNLDAVACKAEFSAQFDKEMKAMYAGALKRVFSFFVQVYKSIVKELPAGDKYIEPFNTKIEEFNKKIEQLEHGEIDIKDLVAFELFQLKHFEPNFDNLDKDTETEKRIDELAEKNNASFRKVAEFFGNENILIYTRSSGVWVSLYNGYKASVTSVEPELQQLDYMFRSLEATEPGWKSMIYAGVLENSIKALDPKFLKAYHVELINAIFHKNDDDSSKE